MKGSIKMKRILALVITFALIIALVASCGGNSNQPSAVPPPSSNPPTSAGGGYSGGSYNLKMGHQFRAGEIGDDYGQFFAARVAELSDGKIKIDVYTDSQLGSQLELAESVGLGTIDFTPGDWAMMNTVYGFEKGSINSLPFLFKGLDHLAAFFQSDVLDEIAKEFLEKHNIRTLGSAGLGFRKCYTQTPINTVDDFKGIKFRVPDMAIYKDTFAAVGAATIVVPAAELYTSLQNGIVNALERPADGMYTNNIWEQTKYVIPTDHICDIANIFVSEITFQKLDADAQAVLIRAGKEVSAEFFDHLKQRDSFALNALKTECNQEIIDFDTTEMAQIMKEKVWPKYIDVIPGGQEIVDRIQAMAG